MEHFSQQRYLNNKSIIYQESGILYSSGNFLSSKKIFIPYEEILYEKLSFELKTDKFNLVVCIIALLTVLKSILGVYDNPNGIYKGLLPLSALFFIAFFIATVLSRRKVVYISTFNFGDIELYDRPEITNFLKDLKIATDDFLKAKYSKIDKDLPIDNQLQNLMYLKERRILSDEEFESLKNKLLGNKAEFTGFK